MHVSGHKWVRLTQSFGLGLLISGSCRLFCLRLVRKSFLYRQLHWLPVLQRITYKLAVLTYKVRSTLTSVYLAERACSQTLHLHSTAANRSREQISVGTLPVFSTVCLELAASNTSHQRFCLFKKSRLNSLLSYDRITLLIFDYYYY